MPKPDAVTLIIVNYNSWQVLKHLLQSIDQQKINTEIINQVNIIIVDNCSTLPAPDFTQVSNQLNQQGIDIQWLKSPKNIGFAAGCNIGAAAAKTPLILFCNPDIEIPENGLNELVNVFYKQKVDLLAPAQANSQGKKQVISGRFPTVARYIPLIGGYFKSAQSDSVDREFYYCDWISGSVILMKNNDFIQMAGWDEQFFMFMEDVDLCYRANQLGLKVGVSQQTLWIHHHGVSSQYCMADRVRSKSAALAAKHIYAGKHFSGSKKYLTHGLIALKYLPELMLGWLLSWLIPKPVFISRRLILSQYFSALKNRFNKSV